MRFYYLLCLDKNLCQYIMMKSSSANTKQSIKSQILHRETQDPVPIELPIIIHDDILMNLI